MGRRAARMAGGSPPTMPISNAKMIPATRSGGVTLKAKAMCEKVCMFMVPVV